MLNSLVDVFLYWFAMKMIWGTVPRARFGSIKAKLGFEKQWVSKLNIVLNTRCSKGYSEQLSRCFLNMRNCPKRKIVFHQRKIRIHFVQGVLMDILLYVMLFLVSSFIGWNHYDRSNCAESKIGFHKYKIWSKKYPM